MSILSREFNPYLLKDLSNIVTTYDDPCDRVPSIRDKCKRGQYRHINPLDNKELNCRSSCTRKRIRVQNSLDKLPNAIELLNLSIKNLIPIDFYGKGAKLSESKSIDLSIFKEWTIIYDLSGASISSKNAFNEYIPAHRDEWYDPRYQRIVFRVDNKAIAFETQATKFIRFSRPESDLLVVSMN